MGDELVLRSVGHIVAERLPEELVRGGEILLTMPEQHTGACVERDPRRASATSVVFPKPASPETNTTRRSPAAAAFNDSFRPLRWCARPGEDHR